MSETLIPVRKAEIALGKPLPWATYDANHVLLFDAGAVVGSESELQALLEMGVYRVRRARYCLPHTLDGGARDRLG